MTGICSGPPAEDIWPRELLAQMRAIAAANAPGSAAARDKVVAALIECLRSLGYGAALLEAEKLLAPESKPASAPGPAAAALAVDSTIAEIIDKASAPEK